MFKIIFFIINTIIGKKHLVHFKINEELDIFNQLKRRIFYEYSVYRLIYTLNNFGDTLIIVSFLKGYTIETAPL